jgi:hypothetical protein
MAFAMVGPISDQAMIPASGWKRPTIPETGQNVFEVSFKRRSALSPEGMAKIAFERI